MKMDWRDKPRPSAPIGVNLRELALSEATAVATSRSPRRASRGMLTAYGSRQPRTSGIWEFFRQKTTFDPCLTPCQRGQMPPLIGANQSTGLINLSCRVLSHGWLAVGYMISPVG
jgi:hypothetical protein